MQSSKLTKDAPAHPKNAPQPATDIPHEDVSKKQSEAQKKYPVPTQVKQGDTVTLTQVGARAHPMPVSACRYLCNSPLRAYAGEDCRYVPKHADRCVKRCFVDAGWC